MKAIKWWCDHCKIWVRPATVSEIYKCPYCDTTLTSVKEWDVHYTVEKPPEEVNVDD